MPKTYYMANAIIDHVLRGPSSGLPGGAFSRPSEVFVGLFTIPPDETGGGTEVLGNGYSRVSLTLSTPVNGVTANPSPIVFPDPTDSWGEVTYYGIFDSVSGGNLLYFQRLAAPRTVGVGDEPIFEIGQFALVEL